LTKADAAFVPTDCLAAALTSAAVAGETIQSAAAKPAAAAKRGIMRRMLFIDHLMVSRRNTGCPPTA
jgi:hypothetical protein